MFRCHVSTPNRWHEIIVDMGKPEWPYPPMTPLQSLVEGTGLRHHFIARRLRISPSQFSKILHGHRSLRGEDMGELAGILRVSTDELSRRIAETRNWKRAS